MHQRPAVLCFSGHDPSGGAGIQADIEALISHHCHPCSVITALTEQNSRNVYRLIPQQSEDIIAQARRILKDLPIAVIKIGLLGQVDIVTAVSTILDEYPDIPVVLDPVLAAGGGSELADHHLIEQMANALIPKSVIVTPNSIEARRLSGHDTLSQAALALLQMGAQHVLLTGTHENSERVQNSWYSKHSETEHFFWERLPYSYHGSGCTLASSIAALLAHGLSPFTACSEAQEYTWNSLQSGYRPGSGQHVPNRFFWMEHGK